MGGWPPLDAGASESSRGGPVAQGGALSPARYWLPEPAPSLSPSLSHTRARSLAL